MKIRTDCKQSPRISGTTPSGCACAHPPEEKSPDWRKAGEKAKGIKDPNRLQAIGANRGGYPQWVRLRAPTRRKVSRLKENHKGKYKSLPHDGGRAVGGPEQ